MNDDPHAVAPTYHLGAPLDEADAVLILLHGRGAPASTLASLVQALFRDLPGRPAALLPEADQAVWYPRRFVEPRAVNRPWLDSALAKVARTADDVVAAGVPAERIVLGGFSQGACLALDAAAARGGRLGGVIAYAGGLIGETVDRSHYADDLAGTPYFLGSSDPDPHIPTGRVEESAELLRALGAEVDVRLYPNLGHTVNEDQIEAGREILSQVLRAAGT